MALFFLPVLLAQSKDFISFFIKSVFIPWQLKLTGKRVVEQTFSIGIASLPIILIIGVFIGLTTAIQSGYQLLGMVPKYFVGMAVCKLVFIELGPIFAAFVVIGRCASAMAAEIGTMAVTEQIDALKVMAINPYRYLALPRILGTLIALPILTLTLESITFLSSILSSHIFLKIPSSTFIYGLIRHFHPADLFGGLGKSLFFAPAIAVSGCYFGFLEKGSAQEVGEAATKAVVTASILVLFFDFVAAFLFFR